ncbi:RNA polymerase sigma factor [Actinokineospora sp. 24-640]
MTGDRSDPEPPVQAPPLGQDRLGAPDREHDAPFSTFYRDYTPSLVRFLRWQGVPLGEATDIAQETMTQLYRHWPTVTNKTAWARTVASRRWARRIADTHREQPVNGDDLDTLAAASLISTEQILAYEQRHHALRLLNTLPPRQRQVLAWTLDGHTPTEIAEELQITSDAVRANLHKARRTIAQHVRKEQR